MFYSKMLDFERLCDITTAKFRKVIMPPRKIIQEKKIYRFQTIIGFDDIDLILKYRAVRTGGAGGALPPPVF